MSAKLDLKINKYYFIELQEKTDCITAVHNKKSRDIFDIFIYLINTYIPNKYAKGEKIEIRTNNKKRILCKLLNKYQQIYPKYGKILYYIENEKKVINGFIIEAIKKPQLLTKEKKDYILL